LRLPRNLVTDPRVSIQECGDAGDGSVDAHVGCGNAPRTCFVPIANLYVSWKIAWRVANLPWRDWELLPGEPAREHDLVPPPAKRYVDRVAVRRD